MGTHTCKPTSERYKAIGRAVVCLLPFALRTSFSRGGRTSGRPLQTFPRASIILDGGSQSRNRLISAMRGGVTNFILASCYSYRDAEQG